MMETLQSKSTMESSLLHKTRHSLLKAISLFIGLGLGGSLIAFGNGGKLVASAAEIEAISFALGPTVTRRLTPEQYQRVIRDVFGPTIGIRGRLDPTLRVDGLLEVGAGRISVPPSSMEQYDLIARGIADQVMDEQHRDVLVQCKPISSTAFDEKCAEEFIGTVGRFLFRRPLSQDELSLHVDMARIATATAKNYSTGLSLSLAALLVSPQFLFRHEVLEANPDTSGKYTLDAYSKASRLSFFLWDSAPDGQLLAAAEKGELRTQSGLLRQVNRMVASPRLRDGVRAFFTDMLHLDAVETLTKDTTIYPKFSSAVAKDAREQMLKTIVDVLVTREGDYRDIFTTKKTFLTKKLAAIYQVPITVHVPTGSPDTWRPYEFSANDPRAGILTHLGFLTVHSHPGRSSPTLRGKALREILLCQKVPAPPGDVDFTLVQETDNALLKTARDRLTAHSTEPMCSGCHKIMDPLGLALEKFDGGGTYRTSENGTPIDASGVLDGVAFNDGADLGKAISVNPASISCLVDRLTSYALGRSPVQGEMSWVNELYKTFATGGYAVPALMQEIALSSEFYHASISLGPNYD